MGMRYFGNPCFADRNAGVDNNQWTHLAPRLSKPPKERHLLSLGGGGWGEKCQIGTAEGEKKGSSFMLTEDNQEL